ncbi:hypothetical protein [Streptomyces sp. NPDC059743]|uniref:hypothetical protein n=1 Tax=Streptomyces sp. NPDC059743 TaxID=3346928 RepID=UPI0036636ECA
MRRGLPALALAALPVLAAVPAADAADAVESGRTVQSAQPRVALRSDSRFYAPATLGKNQAWTSGNGRAILRVQSDGNVVLYNNANRPVWATNTGD